jgi:tetratricopeptide (TPR) repeat protein
MSKLLKTKIKCQCGNVVDVDLWQSVNVTLDPDLIVKVKQRKVNNYHCNKCGANSELAFQFLYNDMDNKKWVWCYPEQARSKEKEIKKELKKEAKQPMYRLMDIDTTKVVFGYDELFTELGFDITPAKRGRVTDKELQLLINDAWKLKKENNLLQALDYYNDAFDILVQDANEYANKHGNPYKDQGDTRMVLPSHFDLTKKHLKGDKLACTISNNMGTIFAELGDEKTAKEMFQQAIELTPDNLEYNDPKIALEELK